MKRRKVIRLVQEALEGLPCEIFEYGADLKVTATEEQVIEILTTLLSSEQAVTVRTRFCMGDMYNQINKQRGMRKAVSDAISQTRGENVYKLLRQYAWVANKWPRDRRTDNRPWSYYIRNKPGIPGQPDVVVSNEETRLEIVSIEKGEGENVFHLKTSTGRKFVLRLPEEPLPLPRERMYSGVTFHEERAEYAVKP